MEESELLEETTLILLGKESFSPGLFFQSFFFGLAANSAFHTGHRRRDDLHSFIHDSIADRVHTVVATLHVQIITCDIFFKHKAPWARNFGF